MDGLAARSQYRSIFHILRWKVCNVSKCATWELWEVGQSTNQPPFFASRLPIIRNVYYGRLGKKGGIFWNNICLTGCKWSSLNVPSTGTPVSHPHLGESFFLISIPLEYAAFARQTFIGHSRCDSPFNTSAGTPPRLYQQIKR